MENTSPETRRLFLILGFKCAIDIFTYLSTHEMGRHTELRQFGSVQCINMRLKELLNYNLIDHHLNRNPKRTEYYTITKKGKEALRYINSLINLHQKWSSGIK